MYSLLFKISQKINWQLSYKEDGSKNILATRDNQFLNIVNYFHKISVFKIKFILFPCTRIGWVLLFIINLISGVSDDMFLLEITHFIKTVHLQQ